MYEALGECLYWLCALGETLKETRGGSYMRQRDTDGAGRCLPGLRYARNQDVHGVMVVDVPN